MALHLGSVHAIVPTRGDLDLTHLIDHLHSYPEIGQVDLVISSTPFNRYVRAMSSPMHTIYVQDDDCQTDLRPLFDAFIPGEGVMVNAMTPQHQKEYKNSRFTLCGFGAIFDKAMLRVFDGHPRDALFYRESDRIMGSVPHRSVFPAIFISSDASLPNRLWRQPDHRPARVAMEKRILERPIAPTGSGVHPSASLQGK